MSSGPSLLILPEDNAANPLQENQVVRASKVETPPSWLFPVISSLSPSPAKIAKTVVMRPKSRMEYLDNHPDPPLTVSIPLPIIFYDKKKNPQTLRCVCSRQIADGLLIRCSKCGNMLHGSCVGKATKDLSFVCPYCSQKAIRCACEQSLKYDEPIIQCTICKYWVHKPCAGLTFGPNPHDFVCIYCGGLKKLYHLPIMTAKPIGKKTITCDREQLLRRVPDGELKNMIIQDLDKTELEASETIARYFNVFAPALFDYTHEFWKIFVSSLSDILSMSHSELLDVIDELIQSAFYIEPPPTTKVQKRLRISDSIVDNINTVDFERMDSLPAPVDLQLQDGRVLISQSVINGTFLCEMTGVLCHMDEVDVSQGIPLSCIVLPDTEIVIDVSHGPSEILKHIRRSFHFNTQVRILRVLGEIKICLFAMRMKGPLAEEKMPREAAIVEGSEILLPLDCDIPYAVEKILWKLRKPKGQVKQKNKPSRTTKPKDVPTGGAPTARRKSRNETQQFPYQLSLLSGFMDDSCPPIPLVLSNSDETTIIEMKARQNSHRRPTVEADSF